MFTKEEYTAIDVIMKAVEDGLKESNAHPEYSTHQQSMAAGSSVTGLPHRFRINDELVAALRVRLDEEYTGGGEHADEVAFQVFEQIKHGSEEHQAWLMAALLAFYRGEEVPPPAPVAAAPSTPEKIMEMLKLTEDQAVELVDAYVNAFPGARAYFDNSANAASASADNGKNASDKTGKEK